MAVEMVVDVVDDVVVAAKIVVDTVVAADMAVRSAE